MCKNDEVELHESESPQILKDVKAFREQMLNATPSTPRMKDIKKLCVKSFGERWREVYNSLHKLYPRYFKDPEMTGVYWYIDQPGGRLKIVHRYAPVQEAMHTEQSLEEDDYDGLVECSKEEAEKQLEES